MLVSDLLTCHLKGFPFHKNIKFKVCECFSVSLFMNLKGYLSKYSKNLVELS